MLLKAIWALLIGITILAGLVGFVGVLMLLFGLVSSGMGFAEGNVEPQSLKMVGIGFAACVIAGVVIFITFTIGTTLAIPIFL